MTKPVDAIARHWTDLLPAWARPYAQLSRLDRPAGWQLLLAPCLMGLALARTQEGFWPSDIWLALLFLVGAIAMRGAGCTYNDILDRRIDAEVARTALRPIPSGAVSLKAAWAWTLAQCAVGAGVLLGLPREAQIAALLAIPVVGLYPLMKRITWWPQAWLGVAFSWGALVAGAAVDAAIEPAIWLLYAGACFWTIGYDTIYALQDREDDALVGVRSTARLFGARWRAWTTGFFIAAVFLWAAAARTAGAPAWAVLSGFGAIGWLLATSLSGIDAARPETALKAFRRQALIGFAAALAFALEPAWRTAGPFAP
jgi:4-hydroxybenzoate polyprenyltransferase